MPGMRRDNRELSVVGIGTYLPPSLSIREVSASLGGDPDRYRGWTRYRVARADDHPSSMGAAALGHALDDASCGVEDLALVLFVGVSRDYPASWSVATEVMRLVGASHSCLGLDLQVGCLGVLPALEIARSWLGNFPGRHAAIVAAERWSHTVSRDDAWSMGMWGHSDGAGALIVTHDPPAPPLAVYRGSRYVTWSEDNDAIVVKYGGTRFPAAPAGESPFLRRMARKPYADPMKTIIDRYTRAVRALSEDVAITPERVVCNQISPRFLSELAAACDLQPSAVCLTGDDNGHIGSVDVILGLQRMWEDDGGVRGDVLMAASTPYAVGAAALSAPPEQAGRPPRAERGPSG